VDPVADSAAPPAEVPLSAVLFDFGETLFGHARGHLAIVDVARTLGVDVDETTAAGLWRDIHRQAARPEEMVKGRDLSLERHRAAWLDLYAPAESLASGMAEALYALESSPAGWQSFPDTAPTLETLVANGISIAVVSDTGWDIRPVFEASGLDDYVDVWVLSGEHGRAKPAVELFELACRQLEVDAGEALMVGDNPLTDGGAIAAGIRTYLLPVVAPGSNRGLAGVLRLLGLPTPIPL
jgi:HAD superfamily hydrolase (TIGR01549 family)